VSEKQVEWGSKMAKDIADKELSLIEQCVRELVLVGHEPDLGLIVGEFSITLPAFSKRAGL
jgi:phosphohistidine phosphatase SixA